MSMCPLMLFRVATHLHPAVAALLGKEKKKKRLQHQEWGLIIILVIVWRIILITLSWLRCVASGDYIQVRIQPILGP